MASNDLTQVQRIKKFLNSSFKIKDLGPAKYFLGLEVARSSSGISVCQRKYVLELLQEEGYGHCKPTASPMDSKLRLSSHDDHYLSDPSSY